MSSKQIPSDGTNVRLLWGDCSDEDEEEDENVTEDDPIAKSGQASDDEESVTTTEGHEFESEFEQLELKFAKLLEFELRKNKTSVEKIEELELSTGFSMQFVQYVYSAIEHHFCYNTLIYKRNV
ncbi:hypothetical protein niasHT_003255 [Heterodera trifolii]|uniref:Uncharacterized protein n=1 Tax=Heterodera trifolii TaxID=157864 RepID=A0ABD2LS93_9BILA